MAVPGADQGVGQVEQLGALAQVDGLVLARGHDVADGGPFEDEDLRGRVLGDDEVGVVAGQGPAAEGPAGGVGHGGDEAADELASEVLQGGGVGHRAGVGPDPAGQGRQPLPGRLQRRGVGLAPVPVQGGLDDGAGLPGTAQERGVHAAQGDGVLDVVDGVADVVGQVHDLGLQAAAGGGGAGAHPLEDLPVVVVAAVLAGALALRAAGPAAFGPGVLGDGVEAGPGEVEARAAATGGQGLGLQAGQQPQGLGVALEAADGGGDDVEGLLPVVPVGRVAEVVGQARGVDDVGVAAQGLAEGASDLGHLQGVGETGAHEVVAARTQHLCLGSQTSQGGGVQDSGAVALERGSLRVLGRFDHKTLNIALVVPHEIMSALTRAARLGH